MVPVGKFVDLCLTWAGTPYVFGAEVKAPNFHPNILDCSEMVQLACDDLKVSPTMPDGSWNQFAHCKSNGLAVSVAKAVDTRGALLFMGTQGSEHVAVSLGNGMTIEARGRAYGTGSWNSTGRPWSVAGLIPGIDYSGGSAGSDSPAQENPDDMEATDVAAFITTDGEGLFVTNGITKRWVNGEDDRAGLVNTKLVHDFVFGLPKGAFDAILVQPGGGAPTGSTKGQ